MRISPKLLIAIALLANQVVISLPIPTTESAPAQATADGSQNQNLIYNTNSPSPITIYVTKADFDQEVLAPLQASQAAKAASDKLKRTKRAITKFVQSAPVYAGGGDIWYELRLCEAGGNYARNSGNGFYGAYQFDIGTWAGYGGYMRPDLAPPSVQDQKAKETQAARGWYPWPSCARKIGLL